MASLNEDSMAGVDDSGYRPPQSKGCLSDFQSDSTNTSNMLDGLKQEFAEEDMPNL